MIGKRLRAFRYAFKGMARAFAGEQAFYVHAAAAVLVVIAGMYFGVSRNEWIVLILCISLVFAAELFNTAMEKLCDLYSSQKNETIAFIKDVSAAAVLMTVAGAVCSGILVFYPYISQLMR